MIGRLFPLAPAALGVWLALGGALAESAACAERNEEEGAAAPSVAAEILAEGLHDPCGVAVQPRSGAVFVAESGAGRVVWLVDGRLEEAIVGFPLRPSRAAPGVSAGPTSLMFFDVHTLLVAQGGRPPAESVVTAYRLPGEEATDGEEVAPTLPLKADAPSMAVGPLAAAERPESPLEETLSLALTPLALYAAAAGEGPGAILRADRNTIGGTKFVEPRIFLVAAEEFPLHRPAALTISPRGELVALYLTAGEPPFCRLAFFNARNGRRLLDLAAPLHHPTALLYGPKTGYLYALDAAWDRPEAAGLVRLDAAMSEGRAAVQPVRLAALEHPTAMAAANDGSLLVTLRGRREDVATEAARADVPRGSLVRLRGPW